MSSLPSALRRVNSVWRHHGISGVLERVVSKILPTAGATEERKAEEEWIHAQLPLEPRAYSRLIEKLSFTPRISIICPVCDPPLHFLKELVESVQDQVYEDWELCLADDASSDKSIVEYLKRVSEEDSRIKILCREKRGHIAAASQSALSLATGEYVALLDHDDLLPRHSLFHLVEALQDSERPEIIYTDEAKIDEGGELFEPSVKPDWSPTYFRSFMYVGHLTVYERALLEEVGGFREGFDGSQDYDLLLRASLKAKKIQHIPRILYYWRSHKSSVAGDISSKEYAFSAAKRALEEHVSSIPCGLSIGLDNGAYPGTTVYKTDTLPSEEFCSIAWSLGDPLQELRDKIAEEVVPFLYLHSSHLASIQGEELKILFGKLAFPDVLAVSPLLVSSSTGTVLTAGWSRFGKEFTPNLSGESLGGGGPGHRLYVPHEVDALSLVSLVVKREPLLEILDRVLEDPVTGGLPVQANLYESAAGGSGSLVLDPSVKLSTSSDLIDELSSGWLCSPSQVRHYPVGYNLKQANYRFG